MSTRNAHVYPRGPQRSLVQNIVILKGILRKLNHRVRAPGTKSGLVWSLSSSALLADETLFRNFVLFKEHDYFPLRLVTQSPDEGAPLSLWMA